MLPVSGRPRRWHVGASLLAAALAFCLLPGVADAKKKRDKIGVATYNLYLGSDLGPATAAGLARRTDGFANEVGFVLKDVLANDFQTRAKHIATDIKKRKADLIGLQEAALWKLQVPTDGSGLNPAATRALNPVVDYVDELLRELNKKAKSARECKTQGIPKRKCFRGYKLVVAAQEADLEFLGDFDNDPGPDGRTADISDPDTPNPFPPIGGGDGSDAWLWGNDDTGVSLGDPPAPQCNDGIDNDGDGNIDYHGAGGAPDAQCPSGANIPSGLDNSESEAGIQPGLPQDANFDSHAFAGASVDPPVDGTGQGTDPAGVSDCQDNDDDVGPAPGSGPGGIWTAPNFDEARVNVCLFHGIDGDLSLTMRDAIIKRRGAGVKTKTRRAGTSPRRARSK